MIADHFSHRNDAHSSRHVGPGIRHCGTTARASSRQNSAFLPMSPGGGVLSQHLIAAKERRC